MESFFKKPLLHYLVFTAIGVVLVLWQLLLPGYVLFLDWVPGPQNIFPYHSITSWVQAPSYVLIYALGTFLPMWVVQKVLLIGVVAALFFLPLYFYPWQKTAGVEYFTALLAVCNPFVYERLLAGQWRVLAGYALLFPLLYFLHQYTRTQQVQSLVGVFGSLLITGFWSIHFLAIGVVVAGLYFLIYAWQQRGKNERAALRATGRRIFIGLILMMLISAYWMVPLITSPTTTQESFTNEHFAAFATARDDVMGVVPNVLTLHGFWVESHAWVDQFILAKDAPVRFYSSVGLVLLLVMLGVRASWRTDRRTVQFHTVLFLLATVFAAGVSAYGIWGINAWLLEHVPLWNGFRDTHKWAAVLAVLYALYAARGLQNVFGTAARRHVLMRALAFCLPVCMTPYILFGLHGQVVPVDYPDSWYEVATLLQVDSECRAVFLPWHQYYSHSWNQQHLTANPSKNFFRCDIIAGQNTELGAITDTTGDATYQAIAAAMTQNASSSEHIARVLDTLRRERVHYVIFVPELRDTDIYTYPFLKSSGVGEVLVTPEITLYKIVE